MCCLVAKFDVTSRSISVMGLMKVVVILFLLSGVKTAKSSLESTGDPSGWGSFYVGDSHHLIDTVDVVDPSGWNYDRETKTSIRKENEDKRERIINVCKTVLEKKDVDTYVVEYEIENAVKSSIENLNKAKTNDNMVFVKRFISILLHAADLSEKGSEDVSRVIEIKMSREQLQTLQHFTNSKVNISLRELDYLLSTSIHRKPIPTFGASATIENIFFMVSQKEVWLPLFLIGVVIGILRILGNSKSLKFFAMSVLILIFCIAYIIEYYKMYKTVEIRQKRILDNHPEVPKSCNPANLSWLESFLNQLASTNRFKTTDECEQYQKALLLDPIVEVSPVRVLSSILADFIVEPTEKFATCITIFTSTIIGNLPFFYGWIVWAGSSITGIILFLVIVVICLNGSLRVGGLFGSISISKKDTQPVANASPTKQIASDAATDSRPILQGVTGIKNPIIIDANSLQTLLLRSQSNIARHHSGVEELLQPSDLSKQSRPFDEKLHSTNDEMKSLNVPEERRTHSPVSESSHPVHKLKGIDLEKNISCMNIHEIENVSEAQSIDESVCQAEKKNL